MSTNIDTQTFCDKCGRPIPIGKGYIMSLGWIICGICEWESSQVRNPIPTRKEVESEPMKYFNELEY